MLLLILFCLWSEGSSHGMSTLPPARNNGSVAKGGNSYALEAFWFSQPTFIFQPTLPSFARTINLGVDGGALDFTRLMPWRAPGTAPVKGSGCGVAGGSRLANMTANGGVPPRGYSQGQDFLAIPSQPPTTWPLGSVQEVAWAALANHGGGYSWRLCPADGEVNEECFQRDVLSFVGNSSQIRYADQLQWGVSLETKDFEIPRVTVSVGTYPRNSEWARNPIPACKLCSSAEHAACASRELTWLEQQQCSQACSGVNLTACPPGLTQFDEPLAGLSGFAPAMEPSSDDSTPPMQGFPYSIVDRVRVPNTVKPGRYLLSWRWDCEQSSQVWQNCADLHIVP